MTAPLRFALVQIEPTDAQRDYIVGDTWGDESTNYAAMLAASPGNARAALTAKADDDLPQPDDEENDNE